MSGSIRTDDPWTVGIKLAEAYHKASSYTRSTLALIAPKAAPWSPAPKAELVIGTIVLPQAELPGVNLQQVLQQRRSCRAYDGSPLSAAELSAVLGCSLGVTHPLGFRSYPSGGALFPLTAWLVTSTDGEIPAGIWRYLPDHHALAPYRTGVTAADDFWSSVMPVFGQESDTPPAAVVLTADHEAVTAKYGVRAYRLLIQEAGHAAQNLQLVTTAAGLGSVVLAAFFDEDLNHLLEVDGQRQFAVTVVPFGRGQNAGQSA